MIRSISTLAVVGLLLLPAPARADAVNDWNAIMLSTISGQNPFGQARFAAITQLAVFEKAQGRSDDRTVALRAVTDWIAEATLQ